MTRNWSVDPEFIVNEEDRFDSPLTESDFEVRSSSWKTPFNKAEARVEVSYPDGNVFTGTILGFGGSQLRMMYVETKPGLVIYIDAITSECKIRKIK